MLMAAYVSAAADLLARLAADRCASMLMTWVPRLMCYRVPHRSQDGGPSVGQAARRRAVHVGTHRSQGASRLAPPRWIPRPSVPVGMLALCVRANRACRAVCSLLSCPSASFRHWSSISRLTSLTACSPFLSRSSLSHIPVRFGG